jgi:hypothetical protein
MREVANNSITVDVLGALGQEGRPPGATTLNDLRAWARDGP